MPSALGVDGGPSGGWPMGSRATSCAGGDPGRRSPTYGPNSIIDHCITLFRPSVRAAGALFPQPGSSPRRCASALGDGVARHRPRPRQRLTRVQRRTGSRAFIRTASSSVCSAGTPLVDQPGPASTSLGFSTTSGVHAGPFKDRVTAFLESCGSLRCSCRSGA